MTGKAPTKYSAKVHETIVTAVRKGNPKQTAARLAGIHPDTLWEWTRMGKDNPEQHPHFAQLAEDIETAKAEIDEEMLAHVLAAPAVDPKHWTAAAWFLERTSPQHFSKQDKVAIEAGDKPLIQLNQLVLVDEGARVRSRQLLRAVTGFERPEVFELEPAAVTEEVDDDPA